MSRLAALASCRAAPTLGPALALALGLALAGCVELPRPFAHRGPVTQNELIELPSGEGVRVVVIDGLDPDIADPLRKAAVKALADRGIPASGERALASGYVLTGAVQIEDPVDGGAEAARFVWQLTGRDGLAIGAFDKEVSGKRSGWLARDPAVIDAVAKDVGTQVADLLRDRSGLARHDATVDGRTEAAVAMLETTLFFEGVIGAPGDGDEALTRAMTSVLKRSGVPLAPSIDKATHLLAATVSAVGRDGTTTDLTIEWHLSAKDGSPVGTIAQKNPVRTALIANRWGELAHIVASAASDGILDAFEVASTPVVPESGKKLVTPAAAASGPAK